MSAFLQSLPFWVFSGKLNLILLHLFHQLKWIVAGPKMRFDCMFEIVLVLCLQDKWHPTGIPFEVFSRKFNVVCYMCFIA